MGCWNKTCGFSGLPIHVDEPVMVFTIVENTIKSDYCYTSSMWRPVFVPFYSVYNDYGAGENSSGIGLELIIDSLKQRANEKPLGDNKYHDIEVRRDAMDEALYFNAIHENRLTVNNWRGNEEHVHFVMFHKRFIDHLLDTFEIESYKKGSDGNYHRFTYKFKDLEPGIDQIIDLLVSGQNDPLYYAVPLRELKMSSSRNSDNLAMSYIFTLIEGSSYLKSDLISFERVVVELLKNNDLEKLREFVFESLKFMFIDTIMSLLRKSWVPGAHEGSQTDEPRAYRSFVATMTHILDENDRKYKEEFGDDEE